MLLGQAIILGIIQGITEFLPISSSGHLIVIPSLFQWVDQGLAFDAIVHLGTLAAVVVYFWRDLKNICTSFFSSKVENYKKWRKLGYFLLIATIPAAIFGLVFKESIGTLLRSTTVVASSLLVWAIVMLVAEEYSNRISKKQTDITSVTFFQAVAVGFWQVIALIPGTSRSGITMIGGMFAGLDKEAAVRFSFLLSTPIIAAAGLFSLLDTFASPGGVEVKMLVAGFVTAFLSGYLAIAFLLKVVNRFGFKPFAAYRIILALLLLLFL
ncbi:MAG: undecaprenyl-diphosphatase UppP [Patescibacteria group bacterium]